VLYRVHKMLMVDQKHTNQSVHAFNSDPMSKLPILNYVLDISVKPHAMIFQSLWFIHIKRQPLVPGLRYTPYKRRTNLHISQQYLTLLQLVNPSGSELRQALHPNNSKNPQCLTVLTPHRTINLNKTRYYLPHTRTDHVTLHNRNQLDNRTNRPQRRGRRNSPL
jgi:hypothetical protein